jgi:hypothetical protein
MTRSEGLERLPVFELSFSWRESPGFSFFTITVIPDSLAFLYAFRSFERGSVFICSICVVIWRHLWFFVIKAVMKPVIEAGGVALMDNGELKMDNDLIVRVPFSIPVGMGT